MVRRSDMTPFRTRGEVIATADKPTYHELQEAVKHEREHATIRLVIVVATVLLVFMGVRMESCSDKVGTLEVELAKARALCTDVDGGR